jgi:hypothetical protein
LKVDAGTNGLQIAYAMRRSTTMAADPAIASSGASGEQAPAGGFGSYDFSDMTPREMHDTATKLFRAGEVDLTQLFMLQNMGVPLGRQGASGEFVPLSAAERDTFRDQPYDYLAGARDAISYIEQSGRASDPKSGYQSWQGILNVLQNRQGSPAGLDLVA